MTVAYEKSGDINLAYVKAVEYVNNFPFDEKAEAELVYLEKQLGIYTGEETEAGTP